MEQLQEILKFYKEIGASFLEQRQQKKEPAADLETIRSEILQCTGCPLHQTKKNYVPGEGCANPDVLFIGEGPGETEDNFGRPFIGSAGQTLDKIITKMGYSRETVFIANIVKCRPPQNRDPHVDEVAACRPFLIRQIQALSPRVIVCLGKVAMNNLLGTSYSIMDKRGSIFQFNGIPVVPTFHPSYILHIKDKDAVTKAKWEMWHDMEKVLEIIRQSRTAS